MCAAEVWGLGAQVAQAAAGEQERCAAQPPLQVPTVMQGSGEVWCSGDGGPEQQAAMMGDDGAVGC
jgi:hypothetical protein